MQKAEFKTQDEVTEIWKAYQDGLSYQGKIGIRENIPKYVDFFEGRQWPAPTENTKNMPRPVVNIVKMICRNKKAALLSVPVRLVYKADSGSADAKLFTDFAEYIQGEMNQKQLDKEAVADGVVKGSYFYHYYWDNEAVGLDGQIDGAVRCELIDPLNIFFANPRELDEQKQQWIIISSRESVDAVRAKADKDVNLEDISPDEADSNPYKEQEQDGSKLCTVLTRYSRRDGRVYCEQATKKVVFKKAWAIIPSKEKRQEELARISQEIEAPNNALPDNEYKENATRARVLELRGSPNRSSVDLGVLELYPVVAGYYEKREKCIYGLSEVEGIIPNQKAINFHIAMSLLNAREMAWGKYVVEPNALKGQKISNVPGQVLTDFSGTGRGIKKLGEQSLHSMPLEIVNILTELTRSTTGATEIMSGEVLKAGMSGAAIAQLLSQAQTPIEELRDSFWLVKKKQGLVLAQFFKHFYYFDKTFTFNEFNKESGEREDKAEVFNSKKFEGINFSVIVEATQGTRSSTVSDIAMLNDLLGKGAIDIKAYIEMYPESAIGNKSEILRLIEAREQAEINALKAQVEQYESQLEQSAKVIEKQRKIVDSIMPTIQENNRLNATLAMLQKKYSDKINMQNHKIAGLTNAYRRVEQDAGDFAEEILRMQETKETTLPPQHENPKPT